MVDRNFGPRGRSASRLILGPRSPVGRFILDLERVPNPGSEAATAVSCFERGRPARTGGSGHRL